MIICTTGYAMIINTTWQSNVHMAKVSSQLDLLLAYDTIFFDCELPR